jgi:drug/metabolite transporter (DMT)-like permease
MVQRIAFAFSPTRTSMSTVSEKRYAAALASVSLIWGYNFIMMKIGLAYAGPFQFATLRFCLCAVCLIPVLISEPASPWMLFYYALRRMPAGMAGLGILASPLVGVLAAGL